MSTTTTFPASTTSDPSAAPALPTESAESYLRQAIPRGSMRGDAWACFLAALAAGEQPAWDNAPLVERQMFLATASGVWLDRRAAGFGLERPANVGMPDEAFREYAIQVSSRQQTIPALLEALRVFYGREAVQAHVTSAAPPYSLVDGQSLTLTFDGVRTITLVFHDADFEGINSASAVEVAAVLNHEFLKQQSNAVAVVTTDVSTGLDRFDIYTGTMGARGSVQVTAGAAQVALGLPTSLSRLLDQDRAAYVLTRGKGHVEVIFPSTTNVVSRTVTSAAYLTVDAATPGVGPYLFEGVGRGLSITETATTTATSELVAGLEYRLVAVTDATSFPDEEGWVVFGYGYAYQAGPVHYLGRAGTNGILIDPNFTFPQTVPVGAYVNMLVSDRPLQPTPGEAGDFWLTDSPAGRVAAEDTIDSIAAAGYEVTKTISYPGDIGLGYAGHPTHGVPDISDIVAVFAGSDIDAEVAAARSE